MCKKETKEEIIHEQHDRAYKDIFTNKKSFLNLLKSFIHEPWVKEIDENGLELINRSYILPDYIKKETDIVYRLKIAEREIIFYCLLELQSKVDYQMPVRLFYYMGAIWNDLLKNLKEEERTSKEFRLPGIIPMILYNGENNWTVPRNFKEMLQGKELFGKYLMNFEYILFDVNRYTEVELIGIANLVGAVFLLDRKFEKPEELTERLRKLITVFKKLTPQELRLFQRWFKFIYRPRLPKSIQEEGDTIVEESIEMEVERMISNVALSLENFYKDTLQEGIEQGIEQEKEQTAINALQNGADIEFTAKITGLSREKLKEIERELLTTHQK